MFLSLAIKNQNMTKWEQYGILIVALLIGGGFAFGGIASYAGITGGNQQQDNGFNASIPAQNYKEGSFGMDSREELAVARAEDIVFVHGFYENETQKQQLQYLQQLPQDFNDRVYVSLVSTSEGSDILIDFGIIDFPAVVVIGGGGSSQPDDLSVSSVEEEVCDSFRQLGSLSAKCL